MGTGLRTPGRDEAGPGLDPEREPEIRPGLRRALVVLWPAFMAAGVLEMLVFALVDPGTLHGPGGAPLTLSATAVYSLAFLVFWAAAAAAAGMALWLAGGSAERPR